MPRPARFRIVALPAEPFAPLFQMRDEQLESAGIRRLVADAKPGYPCRITLADAVIGERVLLLPYVHHDVAGPYRSSGPIFVREGAHQASFQESEVPDAVRTRLLSVRAYARDGWMVASEVGEGSDLESSVARLFADPRVAYLHLHHARAGCYSCRVDRITEVA